MSSILWLIWKEYTKFGLTVNHK